MPLEHEDRIRRTEAPGAPPGTLTLEEGAAPPRMRAMAYGPDDYCEQDVEDLEDVAILRSEWPMTWLDIDGVGDLDLVRRIGELFKIHPLVLEDLVHVHQRSKVEPYENLLFVVARMVRLERGLETEQLGIVIGDGFVLTFQEGMPGDCLEPVRRRIRRALGRLRVSGTDYLLYALLDAVVDHYFPVLELYADVLEDLEDRIMETRSDDVLSEVHQVQREMLTLQRTIWPMRDLVYQLRPEDSAFISEETLPYLRDVRDHVDQLLDLISTYRELAKSLIDLRLSLASHRMNEVMHVLTVVGAIFLPLTFITGLYGMNFDRSASPWNMPELGWTYGYEYALGVMLLVSLGMVIWFRRKGWL